MNIKTVAIILFVLSSVAYASPREDEFSYRHLLVCERWISNNNTYQEDREMFKNVKNGFLTDIQLHYSEYDFSRMGYLATVAAISEKFKDGVDVMDVCMKFVKILKRKKDATGSYRY